MISSDLSASRHMLRTIPNSAKKRSSRLAGQGRRHFFGRLRRRERRKIFKYQIAPWLNPSIPQRRNIVMLEDLHISVALLNFLTFRNRGTLLWASRHGPSSKHLHWFCYIHIEYFLKNNSIPNIALPLLRIGVLRQL